MRSPIGVAGRDEGMSSVNSVGTTAADIAGGGGVERPEDEPRMRRRCLNVDVRGEACVGVDGEGGEGGGGGSGRVGGGVGGSSSAGGMM